MEKQSNKDIEEVAEEDDYLNYEQDLINLHNIRNQQTNQFLSETAYQFSEFEKQKDDLDSCFDKLNSLISKNAPNQSSSNPYKQFSQIDEPESQKEPEGQSMIPNYKNLYSNPEPSSNLPSSTPYSVP